MKEEKKVDNPSEAYPKPTETDTQLDNQPEFSEPYANRIADQQNVSAEIEQAQERMRDAGNKKSDE